MIDIMSLLPGARMRSGDRWMVRCPAHDDDDPSLEVWVKPDRVLLKCFGGCPAQRIVDALGIRMRDLFLDKGETERRFTLDVESYHDYRDLEGRLRYQALRLRKPGGGKDFRQRRPDGNGGWVWDLKDVPRVLYRLPDLEKMCEKFPQRLVCVVEGEKKADRLIEIGIAATTSVCGASSPWLSAYSEYLSDKNVAVLPDNNEVGLRYAGAAAGSLMIHDVPSLRIVELDVPPDGDVVDWLDADPNRRFKLYEKILNTPFWSRRK